MEGINGEMSHESTGAESPCTLILFDTSIVIVLHAYTTVCLNLWIYF
jgi:hypothetical protein